MIDAKGASVQGEITGAERSAAARSPKREAYAVVARMIAECRRARSGEMWGPNALIPPGEALVLRELEAIETAMRDASQVTP